MFATKHNFKYSSTMCSIHKKECLTIKLQNAWIYFSFLLKANATLEGGELHLQLANKSATKDATILYKFHQLLCT